MFRKPLVILFAFIAIFSFSNKAICSEPEDTQKANIDKNTTLKGSATIINLKSKKIEYFDDKSQFVATGDVVIHVENDDTYIEADKVIYDQKTEKMIAEDSIKIIKRGQVINGSYATFDLTKESAIIGNPDTLQRQIRIKAETANVYSNETDLLKGKATINDKDLVMFLSTGAFADKNVGLRSIDRTKITTSEFSQKYNYKIKAKEIIVKDNVYNHLITLKHADIIIGKVRIAKIPAMTLTTDKETKRIETTLPEFGHEQALGSFFGYGHVFNLPKGSTLKLAPILSWGDGNNGNIGAGGFGRYMSSRNKTRVLYSNLKDKFVVNGEHDLTENTKILYGANDYVPNGFFGLQRPKNIAELVDYRKVGSAANFDMYLRSSAGFIEQYENNYSTGRFQIQGDIFRNKAIYSFKDLINFGFDANFNIAAYGTGDTYGVLRAGPTISSYSDRYTLWAAYFQGGIYGDSPLNVDRYRYGKSNVILRSTYKLGNLLEIGYFTSLNLSKDNFEGELVTENRFFVMIGPDDLKFKIGYDAERESALWGIDMMLGSERSALEFEKMKIIQ